MEPALINLLLFFGALATAILGYRYLDKEKLLQSKLKRQKTIIEDILKQLYHLEESKRTATLDSLAGALQLRNKAILAVIEKMTNSGLIKLQNNQIGLTTQGRQYALKMVRIHRLWEKYLAEETGHKPGDWHILAEKMEHELDEAQTSQLASTLGSPLLDPHGDPIPDEYGQMQSFEWIPLPSYEVNLPGKIVHIEDEPEVIYKQILDKRLFIGSHISIEKSDNNEVYFLCEGEKHQFSTIVAANIHVAPLTEDEIFEENAVRLSALNTGETAQVLGLSKECRGANRRRLLDLGILPGTSIAVDLKSPLADPVAYKVRNTSIALRKTLADLVLINKENR